MRCLTHLLLPELRLEHSGACSPLSVGLSVGVSEAEDDWEDTDSLLPIDVSSVVMLELSPTTDTSIKEGKKKKKQII